MLTLNGLNTAQRAAVTHPSNAALQVLAGPGSGKTKVLTSRIAYLVLEQNHDPASICAVTFTNKAANEMKVRLAAIIGKQRTGMVRMGTFHALCALFLRRFATKVGLDPNFTVCDAEESKKIISNLLKPYKDALAATETTLKDGTVLSHISRAKAKGLDSKDYVVELQQKAKTKTTSPKDDHAADTHRIVGAVYAEYEKTLRRNNSLDFDDLLLYGVKLFSENPTAASWCRHVLVDEFQDTNITQYELLRVLGNATGGCVTVVGDPDQSIYGWRSAEVGNLARMTKDFPGTKQILLEENYRSTASILNASLAIVSQDKSRIDKSLIASHPRGSTSVLRAFASEQAEAQFIAVEIKRLVASMGGVLQYGDFAILLRFSALSRTIESALQKEAIPSVILGGHKFFERQEIKDILAYLQLVDNPSFAPALTRAINVPSRGIGDKSIAELIARASKTKSSLLAAVENIHDAKHPDIKPPVKSKAASFVRAIRTLRTLAEGGASPAELIQRLLGLIEYEDHLKKTQPDWETRWENVQELITFASEVSLEVANSLEGVELDSEVAPSHDTPLRLFLQASMLSSEGDNRSEEDNKEKVTISTCHAAKGLEWPVVIIPAAEQGTFPFYRSEDPAEERRLLYVACTRAKSLLYITHVSKRKVGGETKNKDISEFVAAALKAHPDVFTTRTPALETSAAEREVVAKVLQRPIATEAEVALRVAEFRRTTRYIDEHESAPQAQVTWHPALAARAQAPAPPNQQFTASFTSPRVAFGGAQPTMAPRPAIVYPRQPKPPSTTTASRPPSDVSNTPLPLPPAPPSVPESAGAGVKRRLGMGRGTTGFPNKKFKVPMMNP
ncbi:ATP-depentend DNA [Mycena chlorophos]|uniref:DNA 3'-5' helicase n=1 Tax=Mycena chlorophos TaxID=658473 RepID=A0A8H6TG35_MYCCL|nr:ATP-depentend DNA [Mycena chlorophos]